MAMVTIQSSTMSGTTPWMARNRSTVVWSTKTRIDRRISVAGRGMGLSAPLLEHDPGRIRLVHENKDFFQAGEIHRRGQFHAHEEGPGDRLRTGDDSDPCAFGVVGAVLRGHDQITRLDVHGSSDFLKLQCGAPVPADDSV